MSTPEVTTEIRQFPTAGRRVQAHEEGVKRFAARNAREAMALVRAAFGDQAFVLSSRPLPDGLEILAMPGAEVPARDGRFARAPAPAPAPAAPAKAPGPAPALPEAPASTVSFREFIRQLQDALAAEEVALLRQRGSVPTASDGEPGPTPASPAGDLRGDAHV